MIPRTSQIPSQILTRYLGQSKLGENVPQMRYKRSDAIVRRANSDRSWRFTKADGRIRGAKYATLRRYDDKEQIRKQILGLGGRPDGRVTDHVDENSRPTRVRHHDTLPVPYGAKDMR